MRRLWKGLAVLLGLTAIMLALLTALLASPAGSRWLVERGAAVVPGELAVRRIAGSLLTGLALEGIAWRQDDMRLQIGRLTLALDPAGLLRGRLGLRRVVAEDIVYRMPATEEDTAAFAAPERIPVPFPLDIGQLSLHRVSVHIGERETRVDDLELSAHLGPVSGLRVSRFRVTAAGVTVGLAGRLALRAPYRFAAQVDWQAGLPEGAHAAGHATLDGDVHVLHLNHRLAAPFTVTTRGEVHFAADVPTVSLAGEWDGLRWPIQGAAEYRSAHGRYTLEGKLPADYHYTLDGDFEGAEVPPLAVQAQGSGDAERLRFERLAVTVLDGRLEATGTLAWKDGLAIDLGIEGSGVNPGLLWPDWPGQLGIRTRLLADIHGADYRVRLTGARLEGRLRAHPLSASGDVTIDAGGVASERLVVRSGDNGLTLSGRYAGRLDVAFSLDATNLGQLVPDLAGALTATGSLRGAPEQPGGRIDLAGTGLRYRNDTLAALQGQLVLDEANPPRSTARVEGTDLNIGGQDIGHVRLEARGWLPQHRLQFTASVPAGSTLTVLEGGYADGRWRGRLVRADFDLGRLGDWRLREPVQLDADARRLGPAGGCWTAEPSSACLEGAWRAAAGWRATARLAALPIERLAGLVELPGRVEGRLEAEAEASGAKGGIEARLLARSAQGTLQIDTDEGSPYSSHYRNAELLARYAGDVGYADFRVELDEGYARGSVESTLHGATPADYPLSGALDVEVPDISLINALVTDVSATGGSMTAQLRLTGTVGAPRLGGYAQLVQGRLQIPDLGIELSDIGLRAQGDGTQRVTLSGSARSDQGTVDLTGEVRLDPQAHWPFHLDIKGASFGVARLPEAYVNADPALRLAGDSRRVELSGDLRIPEAKIEVKQLPESAVRVSDDQVIVGEHGAPPEQSGAARTALVIDIRLNVSNAAHFEGLGLSTHLGGSLRLRSVAGGDIVGEGVMKLKKGTYEGYGQKLVIEQGRLLFNGPLDNPALDIRASRTAGDVKAGIQITGTLQSPLATVYSDPVLPEAEAMSYLLTGRPLSSSSSTESQAITAAAGLGASNPLTKNITEAIGVDLGVESGATQEESMVSVGKQLTSQLHVEYLYGLFNEAWKMKFTYGLSRYFSLTGESGLQQAIDLNVTVDR
jgi:translocation and assembly module TamB